MKRTLVLLLSGIAIRALSSYNPSQELKIESFEVHTLSPPPPPTVSEVENWISSKLGEGYSFVDGFDAYYWEVYHETIINWYNKNRNKIEEYFWGPYHYVCSSRWITPLSREGTNTIWYTDFYDAVHLSMEFSCPSDWGDLDSHNDCIVLEVTDNPTNDWVIVSGYCSDSEKEEANRAGYEEKAGFGITGCYEVMDKSTPLRRVYEFSTIYCIGGCPGKVPSSIVGNEKKQQFYRLRYRDE